MPSSRQRHRRPQFPLLRAFLIAARWRPGRLARNTASAAAWNVARAALQALNVLLLARLLGVDGYGAIAGMVGLYMAIAPFVGVGSGMVLMGRVAQGDGAAGLMRAVTALYWISGISLCAFSYAVAVLLFHDAVPPWALGLFAIAELVIAPMLMPAVYTALGEQRMHVAGFLQLVAPLARCLAAGLALIMFANSTLTTFATVYFAVLSLSLVIVLPLVRDMRYDTQQGRDRLGEVARRSWPFAINGAATTAGAELDKTILLQSMGGSITGAYTAAQRAIQIAVLPVVSLVVAVTPRLFGRPQFQQTRLPLLLIGATALYAVAAASCLWWVAPLLPAVLGESFAGSIGLLRAMCVLVVTSALRQIVLAQLTAANMQGRRNWIEGIGTVAMVVAMLLVVPAHGPLSAAWIAGLADLGISVIGWRALTRRPSGHMSERPL